MMEDALLERSTAAAEERHSRPRDSGANEAPGCRDGSSYIVLPVEAL